MFPDTQISSHDLKRPPPPTQRRSLLGSTRGGPGSSYRHEGQKDKGEGSSKSSAQENGHGRGTAASSTVPQKRKLGHGTGQFLKPKPREDVDDSEIRCRCGSSVDDGFSIACDVCARWCHAACFGILKDAVPDYWACWICVGGKTGRLIPPPEDDPDDDERTQYVPIDEDVVPHASTQHRLRAYAAHWRGVSALSASPPPGPGHTPFVYRSAPPPVHPTSLRPIPPPSHSPFATSYALHAARPAPPSTFLAAYPARITPSSVYLRDPLNKYAHLGAPQRFVHLVGPPLDVCLDARGAGGRARWVRSGCWPNAEVRAFVCREKAETHFGIFATRELKAGEEIVVGWEWDDGNAVHRVGEVAGDSNGVPLVPTPSQRRLLAQLADILHALGGADCACASSGSSPALSTSALHPRVSPTHDPRPNLAAEGEADADCVIRAMQRAVFPPPQASVRHQHHPDDADMEIDIEGDFPARARPPSTQTTTASKAKPRRLAGPGVPPPSPEHNAGPTRRWGPLVGGGVERGIRAVERVMGGGGWGGVELAGQGQYGEGADGSGYGYGSGYAGEGESEGERERDRERDYRLVERRGGWDVQPAAAVAVAAAAASTSRAGRGWDADPDEEDAEIDVVGDDDVPSRPHGYEHPRHRERDPPKVHEPVQWTAQESVCPPKMRKSWRARRDSPPVSPVMPPPTLSRKGKERAMDVVHDARVENVDAVPSSRPLLFDSQLAPAAEISPSTRFAGLSLVSPQPGVEIRRAWLAENGASAAAREVDVLRGEGGLRSAPVDPPLVHPLPPPVHIVETDAELPPASSHSAAGDDDDDDTLLLAMDVGADEPYRPSPASPSPAPESDDDVAITPEVVPAALPSLAEVVVQAPPPELEIVTDAAPSETPFTQSAPTQPPSPVGRNVTSDVVRSPEISAPAPISLKEWTARKRKQREAERLLEEEQRAAEEREREKDGGDGDREKDREKDAQGDDKENVVVPPQHDRLARYLSDLGMVARAGDVKDKLQPPAPPQEDVAMTDVEPTSVMSAPEVSVDEPTPPKTKPSLIMSSFAGHGRLSPLTVSSIADSRTPSPGLVNGIKREPSPLVVNGFANGASKPVLKSPKEPRYVSPTFSSNGVPRPESSYKPLPIPSSPSLATNGFPSTSASSPNPSTSIRDHVRTPSQEEGEILPDSSSPRRVELKTSQGVRVFTVQLARGSRASSPPGPSAPPTQPRSHQLPQRAPPSAPKALRDAQNPNAIGPGGSGVGRGAAHFGGLGPSSMPANLGGQRDRSHRRGQRRYRPSRPG